METFVDIISDIGAQISKIKRCRINQQTLYNDVYRPMAYSLISVFMVYSLRKEENKRQIFFYII